MLKTEKELLTDMIEGNKNELVCLKIREKYLQQQEIVEKSGNQLIRLELGKLQTEMKEKEKWVAYMESYKKDL